MLHLKGLCFFILNAILILLYFIGCFLVLHRIENFIDPSSHRTFFILLHHIGRFIDAYTDRTFLFFYPKCRFLCFISEDVFWCFILEIFLYIYHPIWNYYCFGLNDILLSLFRRGKGSTSTSVIYYQKHDFSCFRSIRFPRMNFVNK